MIFDPTLPQPSVFSTAQPTSSTASLHSVFANAQFSHSAALPLSFAVAVSQPAPVAPQPGLTVPQPGLAAVRRSLAASQRSLVVAPQPSLPSAAQQPPLSPAWAQSVWPDPAPQLLPGPVGPVAVFPPLPAEPAPPSPMSLEEEDLLLVVEEGQESSRL